jgi:hypothetical protein
MTRRADQHRHQQPAPYRDLRPAGITQGVKPVLIPDPLA